MDKEDNIHSPKHVSPGDSGAGLPYAPEGWPEPGDIWGWKVGRRINNSGFYQDRYLYLPEYLHKPSCPKKFQSKLECKRYLQKTFPNIDLGRFFDSFKWKIPSKELTPTKAQSLSIQPPKTLETKIEGPEGRKRKWSFKSPIEQNAGTITEFRSMNKQVSDSTEDGYLKGISGSESDQFLSCNNDSPDNDYLSPSYLAASNKEASDIKTAAAEKSRNGIQSDLDEFFYSLDDILVLPNTETSMTYPVTPNTAVENEKTNCRKKLSKLLAMDFTSLVSSDNLAELSSLASQLRNDSSLTEDEVTKLKLVEKIPEMGKDFLEAKRNIERADKFIANHEAKKVEVAFLKKEDTELRHRVALIQKQIDSSAMEIQEIDSYILQLQSERSKLLSEHESKKKMKSELTSTQTRHANMISAMNHEIRLGHSEKLKWEQERVKSVQHQAKILDKFVSLKGLTFW